LRVIVLEKSKIANTIEDFPEGSGSMPSPIAGHPAASLWLEWCKQEDLLGRWHKIIRENGLDVRTGEGVDSIRKQKELYFDVPVPSTPEWQGQGTRRPDVVGWATGATSVTRAGWGVPGEEREQVYHRLYSPKHYQMKILSWWAAANSAVERR